MFTFSFSNPDIVDEADTVSENSNPLPQLEWLPSERVCVTPSLYNCLSSSKDSLLSVQCGGLTLFYLSVDTTLQVIDSLSHASDSIQYAETLHSDLIPAKYEGGLKVWECTIDLIDWLDMAGEGKHLEGKRVLDLGCGAGLLGIFALKYGASVVFQDYNKEVIEACTIPNVLFNLSSEESKVMKNLSESVDTRCEFYSGDWLSFTDILAVLEEKKWKFDYILTSETIYNPENNHKLYRVLRDCLKNSGTVYLAAKTYYFGVGGSLRQFESLLNEDGKMKSQTCWKCPSGVQREILKITFKEADV